MTNKLNLDFYRNDDIYIYQRLKRIDDKALEIIRNNPDVLKQGFGFYYDSVRKTLLEAFEFDKNAEVLEVNGCLGAITEFLSDKVKSVTVLEFALNNAKIIENRLAGKDNVEIVVGNLKNIVLKKKFDYIFISETLEASRMFFDGENAADLFIDYFKKLLKPNGFILFSVENRFGIKNWCGASDERTGLPYDGLINYSGKESKFELYSKPELEDIFNRHFKYVKFYYPSPDNYYNLQLLSDSTIELFEKKNLPRYRQIYKGQTIVNQAVLMRDLLKIGKFDFFANSFLAVVGNNKPEKELLYSKHIFTSFTRIVKENKETYAEKVPLDDISKRFFIKLHEYYLYETNRLKEAGITNIKLAKCTQKEDGVLKFDYAKGERLDILADKAIKNNDFNSLAKILIDFKAMVYVLYSNRKVMNFTTAGMEKIFGKHTIENVACVKNANFDMNLSNIFKDGNNYTIIDYDKICPYYIPIDYIVYKGVRSIKSPYNLSVLNLFKENEGQAFYEMMRSYFNCPQEDKYFM